MSRAWYKTSSRGLVVELEASLPEAQLMFGEGCPILAESLISSISMV